MPTYRVVFKNGESMQIVAADMNAARKQAYEFAKGLSGKARKPVGGGVSKVMTTDEEGYAYNESLARRASHGDR